MGLELWPALLAGALGGLVMEIARWLPAAFGRGIRLDFLQTWGSLLGAAGSATRAVGLAFHLVLSASVGLLYAGAIDVLGAHDSLWAWGLAVAAVHLSIAGFVVAWIPVVHGHRPAVRLEAGLFASRLGKRDVAAFVLTHFLYGVVVGVMYALIHSGGGLEVGF